MKKRNRQATNGSVIARRAREREPGSNAGALALKYEAIERRPTRRPIYVSTRSEDRELPIEQRQRLISEARDQLRNFSLAGFALRKHLQFVSYYRFSANTDDRAFNLALEARVKEWSRRANCDAARRRSLDELLTLIESHRAVDGDVGVLKRADCRIQIIESDRIRNPPEIDGDWVNGVRIDKDGAPVEYAIHRRKESGGFEYERNVAARDFDLFTFATRADQVRGVSLFAPAVKMISYLYDGIDYALAKLKLEQLLGLKTTFEDGGNLVAPDGYSTSGYDTPESVDAKSREIFGSDIMHLALKVGENAEFMSSQNPSANFQTFCESVVRMIFAALDVPYSFYDGSKTNFYGSKGEFEQYLDTVEKKQQPTIELLNEWVFDWLLPNWFADPADPLAKYADAERLAEARATCGWRGSGFPSWRLFEYVKEIELAVSTGMASPYAVADSFGENIERNIAELGRLRELAAKIGVAVPYGEPQKINAGL